MDGTRQHPRRTEALVGRIGAWVTIAVAALALLGPDGHSARGQERPPATSPVPREDVAARQALEAFARADEPALERVANSTECSAWRTVERLIVTHDRRDVASEVAKRCKSADTENLRRYAASRMVQPEDKDRTSRLDRAAGLLESRPADALEALGQLDSDSTATVVRTRAGIIRGFALLGVQRTDDAVACLTRTRSDATAIGWHEAERVACAKLAVIAGTRGDVSAMIEAAQRERELAEELPPGVELRQALSHLSAAFQFGGRWADALTTTERLLPLVSPDPGEERAGMLQNAGSLYSEVGHTERALMLLEEARRAGTSGKVRAERLAAITNEIAAALARSGQLTRALAEYERAIQEYVACRQAYWADATRMNRAEWLLSVSRGDEALSEMTKALANIDEGANAVNRAKAHFVAAHILRDVGRPEEALTHVERARQIGREGDIADVVATAAEHEAWIALRCGDLPRACRAAREAVTLGEITVANLGYADMLALRERKYNAYEAGAIAAGRLENAADFLYFTEVGRARALASCLDRASLRSSEGGDSAASKELSDAANAYVDALDTARATGKGRSVAEVTASLAAVDQNAARVTDALWRLERATHAGRAAIAAPVGLEQLQKHVKGGSVAIVYSLATDPIVALVVTESGSRVATVGSRDEVVKVWTETQESAGRAWSREKSLLLRKLLVEPLQLTPLPKAIIVTADAPVCSLPLAGAMDDVPVVMVPSLSSLVRLEARTLATDWTIAAIGDPLYPVQPDTVVQRVFRRMGPLTRLKHSREELDAIGKVPGVRVEDRRDKEATESGFWRLLATRGSRWKAVHLSCHATVDAAQPFLSGLALGPEKGSDGVLSVGEVFGGHIDAELVVLSGCETALGGDLRGEGSVGLVSAFLAAGADRVLASTWPVDDAATAALMASFYGAWKSGKPVGEALRVAQASVEKVPEWKDPYYWAGWQLWGRP